MDISFLLVLSTALTLAEWTQTALEYRMEHPAWAASPNINEMYTGTDVDYMFQGAAFEGYVSLPATTRSNPRGVLIAHQWMGLGDYEKSRADEMAAQGYIAFALDVYGKGVRCHNVSCAQATMKQAMENTTRLLGLISAGAMIKAGTDASAGLVALGYCFGGSIVLELARHPGVGASAGVQYAAVSSVHGALAPLSKPAAAGRITARVQIHHAELDYQGDGVLMQLEQELKVGVNGTDGLWETIKYAKCEHGWTEPGSPIYNARASVQAHKSTFEFFEMALGEEQPEANPFPTMPFCRNVRDQHNEAVDMRSDGLKQQGHLFSSARSPSPTLPLVEEFVFSAAYLNSTRQWGKCLHLVVKYRYLVGGYVDYKPLRQEAIDLLVAPSTELPINATWESVNRELVHRLTAQYTFAALSSHVAVRHERSAIIDEPGTHGSIISAGDQGMPPPTFPWVDSFAYDCTHQRAPKA